jgi:hypothetical protein
MASGLPGTTSSPIIRGVTTKQYLPGPPQAQPARPFAQPADPAGAGQPGRPPAPPQPQQLPAAPQEPARATMPQPAPAPAPQAAPQTPQAPAPQTPTAPAASPAAGPKTTPSVQLTRVPTAEEFRALGPGATAETIWGPVIADEQGNPKLVLNEAGAQAYRQARAQAVVKYGNAPFLGDPRAPQPEIEVGRPNFNAFTGEWS